MIFARPFAGLTGMNGLRWLMFGVLALGVLSLQTGRGTLAYFTSAASSTGNQFTAGQLKLLFNGSNPTGAITFDTATTKLKPGDVKYGYFTVQNDDSNSDAVPALFNGSSNGTIQITRTESTSGQSNATNAAALDRRLNITVKDVTGTGAITDSATCASNWSAGTNTAMTMANTTGASSSADRTALTSGTATSFITNSFTLTAGATKNYCVEFAWTDGTSSTALTSDGAAKQGSNTYTITFTGASS